MKEEKEFCSNQSSSIKTAKLLFLDLSDIIIKNLNYTQE